MSFLKKGGTGNPFAAGGQSGGGQPPRGFQANNNQAGGRGGGRNQQSNPGRGHSGHQQHGNPFSGGQGGSLTSNPFSTAGRGGGNQGQQASFGHVPQQNTGQTRQPASKAHFNPFASGGGGGARGLGGGSMDMDGGGQRPSSSVKQHPPQQQNTFNNATTSKGSTNPFAASSHQGVGNVFASNNANVNSFGQAQVFSQNSAVNGGNRGFPPQQQNPFQAQHQSQHFSESAAFAQNQQTTNTGFGGSGPALQQGGNPFFGGGSAQSQRQQPQQHYHQQQHHQHQAAPAAPVRAEVNQQAINAVNMSAALAPSQVEELDLGLSDAGISSATAHTNTLPVPPPIITGAQSSEDSESSIAQQLKALLGSVLSSCPASALSEEPPQQQDAHQLGPSLVAGRVPAVPPARTGTAAGFVGQSNMQANPFAGAGRPAFGAPQ